MSAFATMTMDTLTVQLTNLLALHLDEDTNEDDVVFATFDYIRGVHTVAQMLFTGRRFNEMQWCLCLCQTALEEISSGSVTAVPTAAVDTTSEGEAVPTPATAAPSTTGNTSGLFSESERAARSIRKMSSLSQNAVSKQRRASLVLHNEEDRRVFSALASRTAQLQKRLDSAVRAGWGDRDNDCRFENPSQASRDDKDETRNRGQTLTSIDFFKRHLQRLPSSAPMTLAPLPHASHSLQDCGAQAARPPASAPSERAISTPCHLPESNMWGQFGRTRRKATYPAPEALPRVAPPPPPLSPPPPLVRGNVIAGQSFAIGWNGCRILPPSTSSGRPSCRSSYGSIAAAGGDDGMQRARQLYGSLREEDMPLCLREVWRESHLLSAHAPLSSLPSVGAPPLSSEALAQSNPSESYQATQEVSSIEAIVGSDEGYSDTLRVHNSDPDGSAPARSTLRSVVAPTPRRRELSIPTSALGIGSSESNAMVSPASLQLKGGVGLLSDHTHTANGASSATVPSTCPESPVVVSTTSTQFPLLSASAAADPLPPLAALAVTTSTTSAASSNAVLAVKSARHTIEFATGSLKALHQRCAQTLEQCDELAFSRLPHIAREALIEGGMRQTLDEHACIKKSTGSGGGGGERSASLASPTSAGTSTTPNCFIEAVQLTETRALPHILSSVLTAAASPAAIAEQRQLQRVKPPPLLSPLPSLPSHQLSPNAVRQLHELRVVCEEQLTASEADAHEMRLLWQVLDGRRDSRVALPHVCGVAESDQCHLGRCTQRIPCDSPHRECFGERPSEQRTGAGCPGEGRVPGAAPPPLTSVQAAPAKAKGTTVTTGEGTRQTSVLSSATSPSPPKRCTGSQGIGSSSSSRSCIPTAATHDFASPIATATAFPIVSASNTPSVLVEGHDSNQGCASDSSVTLSDRCRRLHKRPLEASGAVPAEVDQPACASPHDDGETAVARCETTLVFPAIDTASSAGMGVGEDVREKGGLLLGAPDTMQFAVAASPFCNRALHGGTQEDSSAAEKRFGVTPAASSAQPSQMALHDCVGDAAGHYTYNTAVDALVHARLAHGSSEVPRHEARAPAAAAAAVDDEDEPRTVEETLVAWRRTLQAMDSTSTAVEGARDPGTQAVEENVAAARSFLHTSGGGGLATTLFATGLREVDGGVRPRQHGIRCATAVTRGHSTRRIVSNVLSEVSRHVHPCDIVIPAWKRSVPPHPQLAFFSIPNTPPTGVDEARASTEEPEPALCGAAGATTPGIGCTLGAHTTRSASTSAALTFTSAAPLLPLSPPSSAAAATTGLSSEGLRVDNTLPALRAQATPLELPLVSVGEDARSHLAPSAGSSRTSFFELTSVSPSMAAVADLFQQLQAARRLSNVLLGVEDWTAVAPELLARSLPLSVRVVRIQSWWRQRLAVRLRQERRTLLGAYLAKEELRDAAALRLQRQIRVHWAQQALGHRTAACAAYTAQRVAAEQMSTKHTCFITDFIGGGLTFGPSSSITTTPSFHGRPNRGVSPHILGGCGSASASQQVHRAHAGCITSTTGEDRSPATLRRLNGVAPLADDGLDRDCGRCKRAYRTPWKAAATPSLVVAKAKTNPTGDVLLPPTNEASLLSAQPGLANTAAQRIQRWYRCHLVRLYTAQLCRDVRVLSAVVTRRAPLDDIRTILDAAAFPASAAVPPMRQRTSDGVCAGAAEHSVGSPSLATGSESPHSPPNSTTTRLSTTSPREPANDLDRVVIHSLLDRCTGDVYESYLQRGLAARRLGDCKTPLERVSLRDLQRISQKRQEESDKLRQLQEREQRQKVEHQQRRDRQVLEASTTIQRIGRGWRWRRWLRERQLRIRRYADHHQVEFLSRPPLNGIHSAPLATSDNLAAQPVISSGNGLCMRLAGGEAVMSHIMLRLQVAHPQWFGVVAHSTTAPYLSLHGTPAQLAAVATTGAFVAAFASRAEVYSRYRHACARSVQFAWRLHRAKKKARRPEAEAHGLRK
ncbi:hypothetical protein JKF63_06158 [Porcisia hertigi]|uniref:Uncharacterized protein n=1 Tax=Porcisia hertigi TaxID=2761500 RepID=A0A836LEJ9_9TRYP|nr:hypothetical protein JKF63_06158 [Porcisia hertigi]